MAKQTKIQKESRAYQDMILKELNPYFSDMVDLIDHLIDIYQKQLDECQGSGGAPIIIGKLLGLKTARSVIHSICIMGYSYQSVMTFIETGELR